MKAIEVRYYGPTDHRGARLIASAEGGARIVVAMGEVAQYSFSDAALFAARRLAAKMGWGGDLIIGSTKRGWVAVFK